MADDQGHVLLGDWAHGALRYDVSLAGVTTYPDYCDTSVAAVARGARRFQPSTCVAAEGGRKLYMRFFGQDIACYDGKQWRGIRFNDRVDAMHESPKYGVLIQTGPNEHSAMDNGQLRRIDTPGGPMLWSENGLQPYEAALLEAHPNEYLPVEPGGPGGIPWLLRLPAKPAAGHAAEPPAERAASLRGVGEWNSYGFGKAWLSRGFGEGYWAAGSRDVLYRIFAEQVIECRLDQGPLAGLGEDIHQVIEDRAHNLWFFLGFGRFGGVPRLLCKRVDGFALRGPEAAVEVADHGALDVEVAGAWREEYPLQLFWRTDGGRWRTGEIGPLRPGTYQVELIAMGPLGETTPKPLRCSIHASGPAVWVMPHIVGHDRDDDFVLQQAHKDLSP